MGDVGDFKKEAPDWLYPPHLGEILFYEPSSVLEGSACPPWSAYHCFFNWYCCSKVENPGVTAFAWWCHCDIAIIASGRRAIDSKKGSKNIWGTAAADTDDEALHTLPAQHLSPLNTWKAHLLRGLLNGTQPRRLTAQIALQQRPTFAGHNSEE